MKQVSAFAFKRPTSAWLLITADEWGRLDGLEAWTVKLFALLIWYSDFKSGHGRTGYGELITALTPDQPASGPRLWAPSRDDVKKALRRFEALDLVAFDKTASEKRKALFFHVLPRTRKAAPASKLPPELTPTSYEVKQPELTPRIAPGDSEKNSKNRARETPVHNSPSVVADAQEKLKRISAEIGARGTPLKRAPEGAGKSALRATPPGAAPPGSPRAIHSPDKAKAEPIQMDEA